MWLPGYPGVPCENEEGRDEIPQARMKVIAFVLAHAAAIELAIKVPVGRDRISTGECTPGANCLLRDCTSPGTMGPLYDEECPRVARRRVRLPRTASSVRQSIEDYNYNYDPVVKYNGGGQYYDAFHILCSGFTAAATAPPARQRLASGSPERARRSPRANLTPSSRCGSRWTLVAPSLSGTRSSAE